LIPFLLIFVSCVGQNSKDPANFYFPPTSFLTEKTYCFVNQNDTTEKMLWKMKASISPGDTIFQTIILNNNSLSEKVIERIYNGNSKLISYTLYNGDKSAVCTIIDSSVYRTNQNKEESIQWKVTFQDFNSQNIISLTKVRQVEAITEDNQTFLDKIKMTMVGSSNSYEYSVKSSYASNKGLVSYKLTRPNGQIKNFQLVEIK
jgi:hypothetical protein